MPSAIRRLLRPIMQIAVMAILFATPALGQQFEYMGTGLFAAGMVQIALVGDYLYGWGYDFQVFQREAPDSFRLIGGYPFTDDEIYDWEVSGHYVYFTDSPSNWSIARNFKILDISNPSSPHLISSSAGMELYGQIAAYGNYIFATRYDSGVLVIDVSDPQNPQVVATHVWFPTGNMFIEGYYMYVAEGTHIYIADISNPVSPVIVADFQTSWSDALELLPCWPYLYIAEGALDISWGALEIFDITDRTVPAFVGRYARLGAFSRVQVGDSCAFVAVGDEFRNYLLAIDISNPANPAPIAEYDSIDVMGLALSGNYLYTSAIHTALAVFDVSDPAQPSLAWSFNEPSAIGRVSIYDNLAFIRAGTSGLWILGVSNAWAPEILSHYRTPRSTTAVASYRNYAYAADTDSGIQILDISDPRYPHHESSFPVFTYYRIVIDSSYAYIAQPSQGLTILDLSQPANPILAGAVDLPGSEIGVFVQGNRAYVTTSDTTSQYDISIIDVSNPSSPDAMGNCQLPDRPMNLWVSEQYAYLACRGAGLVIVDVSNPSSPFVAAIYDTIGRAMDIAIQNDRVFAAYDTSGVLALNISDPTHPTLEASFDTPGTATGLALIGEYVYVADYKSLLILRYGESQGAFEEIILPSAFSLSPPYPNPFNAQVTIEYALPNEAAVSLFVFDIQGRKVATLTEGTKPAGYHRMIWDAKGMPSGLYFVRLTAGEFVNTKKMTLVK
jgi:hypothetical protein